MAAAAHGSKTVEADHMTFNLRSVKHTLIVRGLKYFYFFAHFKDIYQLEMTIFQSIEGQG